MGKMQTDALGPLFRLEVTADGIGNLQGGLASMKQQGIRRRDAGGVGQRAEIRKPRIDPQGTAVGGEEVGPVGGRSVLRPKRARRHYANGGHGPPSAILLRRMGAPSAVPPRQKGLGIGPGRW